MAKARPSQPIVINAAALRKLQKKAGALKPKLPATEPKAALGAKGVKKAAPSTPMAKAVAKLPAPQRAKLKPALADRVAKALARTAEIVATHQKETGVTPDVLISPPDAEASRVQSAIAAYAAEQVKTKSLKPGGKFIFDYVKFANDPRWLLTLAGHLGLVPKVPIKRPATTIATAIPNHARIAIFGDWGTGLYGAPVVAKSIKAAHGQDPFDAVMHLGDVYYSGEHDEILERFLNLWPWCNGAKSRALNSNHEMYSGGDAYFNVTLPQFGQASSYFAMRNDHWLLLGLDTGYDDHDLDDQQTAWIKAVISEAGDRKIALFSHHQLFSRLDSQGPKLQKRLLSLLQNQRIHLWYWGHEHRCIIYTQHLEYGLRARCVGHGGMPYKRKDSGLKKAAVVPTLVSDHEWLIPVDSPKCPPCRILDGENPHIKGHEDKYGPHGYMTLKFDGPALTEDVYSADGRLIWSNIVL